MIASHQFASRKACVAVLSPAMRSDGAPPANVASGVFPPRHSSRRNLAGEVVSLPGLSLVHPAARVLQDPPHSRSKQLHSCPPGASRNGAPSSEQDSPEFRSFQPDSGVA